MFQTTEGFFYNPFYFKLIVVIKYIAIYRHDLLGKTFEHLE